MYYDVNSLSPAQQYALQIKQNEVNKEKLAEKINSLEDLFALKASIKVKAEGNTLYKQLIVDIDKEITSTMKLAKDNNVDIPKTLMVWFQMKDSNKVFEYSKHLQEDILNGNEQYE